MARARHRLGSTPSRAASWEATCAACASRTRPGDGSAWSVSKLGAEDIERAETLIDLEAVGRAVSAAFGELGAEQREALRLRVIEGRSYEEIAGLLDCSRDVVRARVSRGLRRLAAELEG